MRKKEIVFEGQTFTISPLKVAQVDELYAGVAAAHSGDLSRWQLLQALSAPMLMRRSGRGMRKL